MGHTYLFLENKNMILRSKCFQKRFYCSQLGLYIMKIYNSIQDLDHMIPRRISKT
jgi:hypothetical protein